MRLLAWDTSSKSAALVALEWDPQSKSGWEGVRLVGEVAMNVELTHSERLLWAVDQLLSSARWKLGDVDAFAVGVGPGSFTGLRIGVTTARTLAHQLGKPLIRISSLAALARPAAAWLAAQESRALVIASTDACKGELFALWGSAKAVCDCVTLAEGDLQGLWKRGVEEQVIDPEELAATLGKLLRKKGAGEDAGLPWVVVGEGRKRYPEAWKKLPARQRLDIPEVFLDQVQGRYLGQLAWEAAQAGVLNSALQVHPRYLRASDAELKLKAGLLPPGPTRGDGE